VDAALFPKFESLDVNVAVILCVPDDVNGYVQAVTAPLATGSVQIVTGVGVAEVSMNATVPVFGDEGPEVAAATVAEIVTFWPTFDGFGFDPVMEATVLPAVITCVVVPAVPA
jgi:hypothetical protein